MKSKSEKKAASETTQTAIPALLWILAGLVIILLVTIVILVLALVSVVVKKQSLIPISKKSEPTIIQITKPPSPTSLPSVSTSSLKQSGDLLVGIEVREPKPYALVSSPVRVTGRANVFEGHVSLRVKDANGTVIGTGFGTACMDVEPCPFEAQLSFDPPSTRAGFVEAYEVSAADGSEVDLVQIPVNFR